MPKGMESLEIGHFLGFAGDTVPKDYANRFFRITGLEPIIYETGRTDTAEFSSVASGSNSGFKNIEVLEPNKDHLFALDWGVQDGCRYYIKIPTGNDRLGLDEDMDVGFVTAEVSSWLDPDPQYGFWLLKELYPAISAYNDAPRAVTPKIWFKGVKFQIETITDESLLARLRGYKEGKGGQPFYTVIMGGVS